LLRAVIGEHVIGGVDLVEIGEDDTIVTSRCWPGWARRGRRSGRPWPRQADG